MVPPAANPPSVPSASISPPSQEQGQQDKQAPDDVKTAGNGDQGAAGADGVTDRASSPGVADEATTQAAGNGVDGVSHGIAHQVGGGYMEYPAPAEQPGVAYAGPDGAVMYGFPPGGEPYPYYGHPYPNGYIDPSQHQVGAAVPAQHRDAQQDGKDGSAPPNLPPPEVARMIPCKFFPNCRYGDKCIFQHPTVQGQSGMPVNTIPPPMLYHPPPLSPEAQHMHHMQMHHHPHAHPHHPHAAPPHPSMAPQPPHYGPAYYTMGPMPPISYSHAGAPIPVHFPPPPMHQGPHSPSHITHHQLSPEAAFSPPPGQTAPVPPQLHDVSRSVHQQQQQQQQPSELPSNPVQTSPATGEDAPATSANPTSMSSEQGSNVDAGAFNVSSAEQTASAGAPSNFPNAAPAGGHIQAHGAPNGFIPADRPVHRRQSFNSFLHHHAPAFHPAGAITPTSSAALLQSMSTHPRGEPFTRRGGPRKVLGDGRRPRPRPGEPKPPCTFFAKNMCRYGDDCHFPHILPDGTDARNPAHVAAQAGPSYGFASSGRGMHRGSRSRPSLPVNTFTPNGVPPVSEGVSKTQHKEVKDASTAEDAKETESGSSAPALNGAAQPFTSHANEAPESEREKSATPTPTSATETPRPAPRMVPGAAPRSHSAPASRPTPPAGSTGSTGYGASKPMNGSRLGPSRSNGVPPRPSTATAQKKAAQPQQQRVPNGDDFPALPTSPASSGVLPPANSAAGAPNGAQNAVTPKANFSAILSAPAPPKKITESAPAPSQTQEDGDAKKAEGVPKDSSRVPDASGVKERRSSEGSSTMTGPESPNADKSVTAVSDDEFVVVTNNRSAAASAKKAANAATHKRVSSTATPTPPQSFASAAAASEGAVAARSDQAVAA